MNEHIKKFLACKHHNVQQFTEYCFDCGENRYTTVEEIMKREGVTNMNAKPTADKNDKSKVKYNNPEAFWKVTTEGDCEGRSVRDLGVHFGLLMILPLPWLISAIIVCALNWLNPLM